MFNLANIWFICKIVSVMNLAYTPLHFQDIQHQSINQSINHAI
jgi:hypothetical protein